MNSGARLAILILMIAIAMLLFRHKARAESTTVPFAGYQAGTIVIRTNERRLYLVTSGSEALSFPVGVGKDGRRWSGATHIDAKYLKPAWMAPRELRKDKQYTQGKVVPGGSSHNPMGVAALTLSGTNYAIHGTNKPSTIGTFVSYGCIRMYNQDIQKLYNLVHIGTKVVVER